MDRAAFRNRSHDSAGYSDAQRGQAGMKQVQYADFPMEEYQRRVQRASAVMKMEGLEALILTDPSNLRYLFGFQNLMQLSVNRSFVGVFFCDATDESTLFIPHDCQDAPQTWTTRVKFWDEGHEPPFDDRMTDMGKVVDRLKELGIGRGRIGIDLGTGTRLGIPVKQLDQLRHLLREMKLVDAAETMWKLRRVKSEAEITLLRSVARMSLKAIQCGIEHLREEMTEKELYRAIYSSMFADGVDGQGLLCVQFGVDGWKRANMAPTDARKLRKGDWVYLDGGGVLNGYCADLCRMAMFGGPDGTRRRIYEDVTDVTRQMIRCIQPGMRCCEVYETGRELLEKKGLGGMVDGLSFGHGIGLNVHEMPDLNRNNLEPLEENMALAIEPWVLDRKKYGLFNKEDMIVVREGGAEILSEH